MAAVGATLDDPLPMFAWMSSPDVAQPIQVSILSCSPEEAVIAHNCHIRPASIQCGDVCAIDHRRWYEDTPLTVAEKCGKSFDLHRTIIGSPDFVSAMKTCVDHSVASPGLQIRVHPTYVSYVLAKIEADALNELRTPDDRRVFNARVYCLHEKKEADCRTTIAEALSWLDDDGSRLEEAGDRDARFGFAATLVDSKLKQYDDQNVDALIAQRHWYEWHDILTMYEVSITGTSKIVIDNKVDDDQDEVVIDNKVNDDQDKEVPEKAVEPARPPSSYDVRQTPGYQQPVPWLPKPASMTPSQPDHRRKHAWDSGVWHMHSTWWEGPNYSGHSHQTWCRDDGWGSSWQPGGGSSNTRPSHVTARDVNNQSRTIEKWYDQLYSDFRLDPDAMQAMILLAQYSDEGYQAVNSLMDKLYVMRRKGEKIVNPSAFICKGLRTARERIDTWY